MTLFTNKEDRRLPLLTQFYQLNVFGSQEEYDRVTNDDTGLVILAYEPDRFIYLFMEEFKDAAYSSTNIWSSVDDLTDNDFRSTCPDDDWDGNLQIIHGNVCLVMEAVADGTEETLVDETPKTYRDEAGNVLTYNEEAPLSLLNRYISQYPYSFSPHLALIDGKLVVHDDDNGLEYYSPYDELIATVFHELITFIKLGKRFRYCPECSSVFQPVKEDRKFCSHRCIARAGQRRRRKPEGKREVITI